jgi:hypothetical protein
LVSEYNYQKKKKRSKKEKLFVFDEHGSKRGFGEWVRTAFANPFYYRGEDWAGSVSAHIHRWSPQMDWLSVNGEIAVDFVARVENIEEDFQRILKKLGLPPSQMPHRNRKLHWHYSSYYDQATRELVGEYYARDIEAFGYRFEQCSRTSYFSTAVPRWIASTFARGISVVSKLFFVLGFGIGGTISLSPL